MERSEIVYRMAANARGRCRTLEGYPFKSARTLAERLCDAMGVYITPVSPSGVMLGGAYARLQLWSPEHPTRGGMVWVSQDLPPERAAFAIAHEIGHLMLHPGENAAFHTPCDQSEVNERADAADLRTEDRRVEEYTPRARRELEANAFAAELLAPRAEVRALFARADSISMQGLAAHFGISETLARRCLADAVLAPEPSTGAEPLPAEASSDMPATALLDRLDDLQRGAARSSSPALVVAGPGTGKTATLVGRVAHLVAERAVPPERVLALTFSNRAAGEMRERLISSIPHGGRMPVMTIHAFAATLLREYAARVPCAPGEQPLAPDFRILDEADALLLMEELLGEFPLRYYRSYGNPTRHLGTLRGDFSRACDGLRTPQDYLALVEAMPLAAGQDGSAQAAATSIGKRYSKARGEKPERTPGTFTAEEIARARERARAYAVWDGALRKRGLVDFGGLIQRAVELLRADAAVLAEVRERYPQILVDEFQDTNAAAAELLMLLAGDTGGGLWVVGDRNQAIYRWRGASPTNLRRLFRRYPHLAIHTLRRCYRSVPAVVDLGSAIAERMAEQTASGETREDTGELPSDALHAALEPVTLEPVRPPLSSLPAVLRGEVFADAVHERLGLVATIRRLHTAGVAYRDQAALCRTRKQVEALAQALAESGLPVSQLGGYFEREEVKDALALLALAAGPGTDGLLRAGPLIAALGFPAPPRHELVNAIHGLKADGKPLPGPLANAAVLADISDLSPQTQRALHELGVVANSLRYSPAIAPTLLDFLLRPHGYAWRLIQQTHAPDPSVGAYRVHPSAEPSVEASGGRPLTPPAVGSVPLASRRPVSSVGVGALPAAPTAETSLAALGELVRLAQRFDTRWEQEPDFRKRLSRAVYRARRTAPAATPPIQPDALESDPGADVLPTNGEVEGDSLSLPPELEDREALPVRCFLRYLAALRASDADIAVPAGNEDAVRVMTLHTSKGLEFPVVYLPNLAQGQFPNTGGRREDPSPPGFREDDTPGEKEAEERCLFYVGVTRARDIVVFTRAQRYARSGTAKPSPLLGLMESAPPYLDAPSPLPDGELAALQADAELRRASLDTDDDGDDEETSDGRGPVAIPEDVARSKSAFRLDELEQYLRCPRQYKYASIYRLLDPAEDAVYRFHRYVRRGRDELAQLRTKNAQAGWSAANERLRDVWTEVGPAGHPYENAYWRSADQILREEWHALTDPALVAEAGAPATEALRAKLRGCIVEVHPERITMPESGSAAPAVLVRQHIGRESQEHRKDRALPLLYIAHHQQHPEMPAQIKLAYLGNVLADTDASTPESADAAFQHTVLDVTDDARKKSETYFKPDRKAASTLDNLDRAALGILAGRFPVAPRNNACDTCPYRLICPADPGEDADRQPPVPGCERESMYARPK